MLLIGSSLALVSLVLAARAIVPTTRYPLAALFGADLPPLAEENPVSREEGDAEEDSQKPLSVPEDGPWRCNRLESKRDWAMQ